MGCIGIYTIRCRAGYTQNQAGKEFQTFFGELHERYGQNILRRITDRQTKAGKNATLAIEKNYLSEAGPNPDSVLVESIGSRNVRCVIFEFKVGRPKYKQSLVDGDVKAFQVDMEKKIESCLDLKDRNGVLPPTFIWETRGRLAFRRTR